jgi:uroporphyrin-III C-methyltransferase
MYNDISLAARSKATVVILMGMTHLEKIAEVFQAARSQSEPMALIQQATTQHQKIVIGTAGDIVQRAIEFGISSPAVIVIGKVVNESELAGLLGAVKADPLQKID